MPPTLKHYNYLVIGGGSGGVASARRAASYGAKTLIIEGNRFGGTCVNVGCVPKKVMWYASDLATRVQQANEYGLYQGVKLDSKTLTFNWEQFKSKRDAYVERLNGIYERNLTREKVDMIKGWASFNKAGNVEVKKHDGTIEEFTSDHILIATGGKPILPVNTPGYEYGITSDGFFELPTQPEKVVVVGAGYIGVELTGVFHGLGSETHLVIRGQTVLRKFDDLIQETITDHYINEGINIHKGSTVSKVEKNPTTKKLTITLSTGEIIEDADQLVWTMGRRTFLGLGLENVGVELNSKEQIVVDEYQNTTAKLPNSKIYSLGDVVGDVELTPMAINAGRKLSNRLFGPEKFKNQKADYTNVPSVVFSHPEVGSIGLSEKDAIAKYGRDNLKIYNSSFTAMYFAMLEHKSPTRYKLICEGPNEKVVGLHIIGDSSAEILQGFGVAIKMGATKQDFDNCIAIHPTSAEELVTLT
ncbi:hypothetical protein TBLA_0H03780 [Henningerozyma blattae CBS 6284]|uniref:Glutathione reductase n=1 Tax=Henningerozyma blattae (strain ATCC 34711 / CBS 6284 / DSM 70876 / NBRC 10599 / NRRL Y-10934 / UCD 77-7) TaxID=1071380 RepID=I2H8F7_HENB6|nr:hypothetical protein TBLA_0H03780 [Tetrapisispora blattae CBS 6284]CCH62659.1 hypothetical protein TBLA_0H03780 [Tetrapisispora blattae CBS 6284]